VEAFEYAEPKPLRETSAGRNCIKATLRRNLKMRRGIPIFAQARNMSRGGGIVLEVARIAEAVATAGPFRN
jgi:hypothetical protein